VGITVGYWTTLEVCLGCTVLRAIRRGFDTTHRFNTQQPVGCSRCKPMRVKHNLQELDSEDVDFHVCNERGCQNSYTPYVAQSGDRFCVTHGTK